MHVEVSQVVRAPLAKVYASYTDFEAMPRWSRGVKAVRIVAREGASVRIEVEGASGAGPRVSTADLILSPQEKVETESETRFTRTKRIIRFEEAPEGTRVVAVLDVMVKGRWAWLFAPREKDLAESSAREGLESFAKYAESLP